MYRRANSGHALIRSGIGGNVVSFSGVWVLPLVHRLETIDISTKRIVIERLGKEGLACKDYIRADMKLSIHLRVNSTPEDVLQVYYWLGTERAASEEVLRTVFDAVCVEAMKAASKLYDFCDLLNYTEAFCDRVQQAISGVQNGFLIEKVGIDHLEQTPLEFLDPKNILDAEGIKKIKEGRWERQTQENEIRRKKELDEARKKVQRET